MTYKCVKISYKIKDTELGDLDEFFDTLAKKYMGKRIGGCFWEFRRYLDYAFPVNDDWGCPYMEEFIEAIERLNSCEIVGDD